MFHTVIARGPTRVPVCRRYPNVTPIDAPTWWWCGEYKPQED